MRRQMITGAALGAALLGLGAVSASAATVRIAPPVSLSGSTAAGPVLYDLRLGSADLLRVTTMTPGSAAISLIAPDFEGEYVRRLPLAQPTGGVIAPRTGVYLLRVDPGPSAGGFRVTLGVQRAVRLTLGGRRISPALLGLSLTAKDGVGGQPALAATVLGRRGTGPWVKVGRVSTSAGLQRLAIPKALQAGSARLELLARHSGAPATRPAADRLLVPGR